MHTTSAWCAYPSKQRSSTLHATLLQAKQRVALHGESRDCQWCGRAESVAQRWHCDRSRAVCTGCGAIVDTPHEMAPDAKDDGRGSAGSNIKFQGAAATDFRSRLLSANLMHHNLVAATVLELALQSAPAKNLTLEEFTPYARAAAEQIKIPHNDEALRTLFLKPVAFSGVAHLTPRLSKRHGRVRPERTGNIPSELPAAARALLESAAPRLRGGSPAQQRAAAAIAADLAGPERIPRFVAEFIAGAAAIAVGFRHELRSRVAPATAVALVALGCTERECAQVLDGRGGAAKLRRAMLDAAPRLRALFESAGLAPLSSDTPVARRIAALLAEFC